MNQLTHEKQEELARISDDDMIIPSYIRKILGLSCRFH